MRAVLALLAAFALAACATASAQSQTCPPAGHDRARLEALRAAEWSLPDDAARNALARALTACLGSPDPTLRDGIAFEALSHWLRARQLSDDTMRALAADLRVRMFAEDAQGFGPPFAALALSEVVRADRVAPYMDAALRAALLDDAVRYLVSVRDYRGFDAREGWRHGVAHGADLMLQFALNPALRHDDLVRIRDTIGTQIAPDTHVYIYGESERLARPILYMAQRGLIGEDEWRAWFTQLPMREDAFASQSGLAWRHNLNAFLSALYVNARLSANADDDVLLPGVETALRALP